LQPRVKNDVPCAAREAATRSAAECMCTNRRKIDADEMEQGIAELDVIARYGM